MNWVERKQINIEKWDTMVAESGQSKIYSYSWYLDVVAPNWRAIVSEDYSAIAGIPTRSKMRLSYAFLPEFSQQFGLICKAQAMDGNLTQIRAMLQREFKTGQYKFNVANEAVEGAEMLLNQELDLTVGLDEIQKSYSQNTKRNLKKLPAVEYLQDNEKLETVIEIFKANKGLELYYKAEHFALFSDLCNTVASNSELRVFVAQTENEIAAGLVFFIDRGRAYLMMNAASEVGRRNKIMFGLLDHVISILGRNCKVLDFEGSNQEGLARFNRSFGAVDTKYACLRWNNLAWPINKVVG